MAGVNTQLDVELDGLVELGGSGLADQLQTLLGVIQHSLVDLLGALLIFLTSKHLLHPPYSPTTTPMERAVPAIMLMAASREAAFRSRIFSSAIF